MRLLFLQDWNPLHGGAERFTLELRSALAEAGDEVRLLTADVSPEARQAADHLAHASDRGLAKALLQVYNPFAARAVRRAVQDFQPQVALVNMFALYLSPSAIAALGAVPYVLLVSDYKCICPLGHRLLPDRTICHYPEGLACLRQGCLPLPHWLRDQLRYRRIGNVVRGAAAVVCTSDALRDALAEQGIASRRVYLFSDAGAGVDSDPVRRPAAAPQFLFVGRLDIEKGVDTLLRAFATCRRNLPGSRLRIAGRGTQRAELEQLAGQLGVEDAVIFLGWQDPPAIERELAAAWALVAPSRWPEPFGLVALEAILRGVPAVVPDLGGFAETVEHRVTGLKYDPDDVSALAAALIGVTDSGLFPGQRLRRDAVAAMHQRFSREQTVGQLRSILLESALNAPTS